MLLSILISVVPIACVYQDFPERRSRLFDLGHIYSGEAAQRRSGVWQGIFSPLNSGN